MLIGCENVFIMLTSTGDIDHRNMSLRMPVQITVDVLPFR